MRVWENYCTDTGDAGYKIAEWIEVTQSIAQLWAVLYVVMTVHDPQHGCLSDYQLLQNKYVVTYLRTVIYAMNTSQNCTYTAQHAP